mmetsp:Transcript_23589/g.22623  ORF Transcript_23589/g.22623 Transcript_23589/m.22623 type:complete len:98 (+) Transcript_23589:52-345(+)|eukprot:CAMPEP_0197836066 /NCGR_PEP_ID=MMETSP1437-20131217/27880_1 /TAXON_ID=49252 ORGANISM="Eucampia antarctica, Strain CCMP1452" /NCGR_SAMPLE_ID=MMETSP1437 /ASSEMBLY_ACC=CAM_ASM_001096 /LENGTH=97 /DNA_ID=CAMNT_0043441957 /DNA_START=21 /DNA_END=314 /DNA_ORIENTATION=+
MIVHRIYQGLKDKELIRNNCKDNLLLFEDSSEAMEAMEDYYMLIFGMMSMSIKLIAVQGGMKVLCLYFGGPTILFLKKAGNKQKEIMDALTDSRTQQ